MPSGREPDALSDVAALLLLGEILVLEPTQSVAGDLPAGFLHRRDRFRVALHGKRDAIDGNRHVALGEHPPEPPEAGAGAIFVERFHIHVALARPGLRADDLRQQAFGGRIPIENGALAPLFVVDDELNRAMRARWPFRIGRGAAIANQIAGIGCGAHCSVHLDNPETVAAQRQMSIPGL